MDTKNSQTGQPHYPQTEQKHPDKWEQDLNPNRMEGQNIGAGNAPGEEGVRTAFDVKPLHRRMNGYDDDQLKQIPIVPAGARLQQGATYIDLRAAAEEFTAMGSMEAGAGNAYVAKDAVPYPLWNQLVGVDDPERLDTGNR